MAEIKEIITDEITLSNRSDEIDAVKGMKKARDVIADLKKTIRKKDLHSLAAPAIGSQIRVFCINYADNEIKTYINPIISSAEGLVLSRESSPVIPGKEFLVPRNNKISVMYTTPLGKIGTSEISGMAAAVFQQEIHLLDGILLSDIGLELDEQWDKATQEEREEVINMYLDSLDIKQKEIDKEIQGDADLNKIANAIEFMEAAHKGEVEFTPYAAPDSLENKENNNGSRSEDTAQESE